MRPLGVSQIAATTALRERLATRPVVKVKAQAMEKLDQDLYFDDLSTGRSSAEEKGEGTTSPPAPAGSGPGA